MANGKDHQYLLPAGLKDGLPPDAAFEAAIVERLMACFAAWGYERVKPPLIEFEDACCPAWARRWRRTPSA